MQSAASGAGGHSHAKPTDMQVDPTYFRRRPPRFLWQLPGRHPDVDMWTGAAGFLVGIQQGLQGEWLHGTRSVRK